MTPFNTGNPWKDRALAAGAHLGLSLAVSAVAAALVFFVWYPYPYSEVSGGRELFFLVVAVDVVLGPLLTFAIFSHKKAWKSLRRDLAVIVVLQVAALVYGLWTVAVARPVHLVFEYDRFRPIHAIEIDDATLAKAPAAYRSLSWTGPTPMGLRPLAGGEKVDAALLELSGVYLGVQAQYWQAYEANRADVLKVGKPLADLRKRFTKEAELIDAAVRKAGRADAQLLWLPMVARKQFWTVLVDAQTAQPLAFLPIDSF